MKTTMILGSALLVLSCLAGCGGDSTGFLVQPVPTDQHMRESVVQRDSALANQKVALIDVEGLIVNQKTGPMFGAAENPVAVFQEKLNLAREDSNVKAVMLRINSPGGTVQASEAMYSALQRFRKDTGKPVIAYIQDFGASGAYYIACGSQRILCQSTSITGSIGVIIEAFSIHGTLQKIGVATQAIKSGPMKDMGSPFKDFSEEDHKVLQRVVDEFYGKFLQVVGDGRKNLTAEQIKTLADGRVYTGKQALENGLVDRVCDLEDGIAEARTAGGIAKGHGKVVMYHRPLGYRGNVYSESAVPAAMNQVNLVNLQMGELGMMNRPGFYYVWTMDGQ